MHDWDAVLGEAFGAARVGREADGGVLTEDDWKVVDGELTEVLRTRLTAIGEGRAFNPVVDTRLTGAGITVVETYKKGDRAAAVISMTGEPQPGDMRTLEREQILAPVIHADSVVPWRIGESGMQAGARISLLGDLAADIGAVIAQKMDSFIYGGDSFLGIDGLLRPTGYTTSAGSDWSASAANVETDVLNMLNDLDDNDIGANNNPILFVHTDEAVALRARFGSGSDTTVRQHLLDNTELADIVITKRQTAQKASMVAMTRDNLRIHLLQDMRMEQFRKNGSQRSETILGGWVIMALKPRHSEAFIERTGL